MGTGKGILGLPATTIDLAIFEISDFRFSTYRLSPLPSLQGVFRRREEKIRGGGFKIAKSLRRYVLKIVKSFHGYR